MLHNNITYKLHDANIQADMTGQSIHVGNIVLLKGYKSMDKDTFAVVKKVNRKTIAIEQSITSYEYGNYVERPDNQQGSWNYYPNSKSVKVKKLLKRPSYSVLKLSPAFVEEIKTNSAAAQEAHPEVFI